MSIPPILQFDRYSTDPGVYLMKAADGHVLYVGKAKNLRQRIKQYFVPGGDGRPMIPFLVNKVASIETILVNSEKEALLLENTLIKRHQPPYNALLKDDKSYIALKITRKMWPTLEIARYRGHPPKDGLYFGPYTSANAARTTLEWMRRLFPMRQCSDQEFAKRKRPCILYGMKRCPAPCVGLCTSDEYEKNVQSVVKFLRGQDKELIADLIKEMEQCAERLEFERAAELLRTVKQIEQTIEVQRVDKPAGLDIDAIGIYREAESVVVSQLIFRGGKLIGSRFHVFKDIAQDDQELLESFLLQQYDNEPEIPHEILIACEMDVKALEELLTSPARRKVSIVVPQRGDKKVLLEMAYKNAQAAFKQEYDAQALKEKTLMEMQEQLELSRYPSKIECFDTSNTSGSYPVAVMITFLEGEKETKGYRTYAMKSLTGDVPNDYGAMREVLFRRYKKAKEENKLPDLVVVDGGKGHLNVALKVFAELDITTVDVIGLAKEEGRHDKGSTAEQIFLPNRKDPILLRKTSPVLFLLQQVRDEAHRFAITFHRKRYSKGTFRSSLETIPGIGPAKRKAILIHFGSVKKLLSASRTELQEVPGLSQSNIRALEDYIETKRTSKSLSEKEDVAKIMNEEEIIDAD